MEPRAVHHLPDGVDVAVVVVTWNSAHLIGEFLAAIPAACEGLRHVTVVVDNHSSDETRTIVATADPGSVLVSLDENRGYAAGLNAGIGAVTARSYLVCNPDVRLEPGSVAELSAALTAPGVGIAVPRIVDDEGRLVHSLRREPSVLRALAEAVLGGRRASRLWAWGETVGDDVVYAAPHHPTWASGAAMLISAECARAVGDWDEGFFLYSEETDFALRARDAGYLLRYEPAATIVHPGGALHRSSDLWSLQAANRIRLFRKRHGPARTAAFWLAVCLNEALRSFGSRGAIGRPALGALLRRAPRLIAGSSA